NEKAEEEAGFCVGPELRRNWSVYSGVGLSLFMCRCPLVKGRCLRAMRITRLELRNIRSISHLIFEDLPDTVVLVSPNGVGKSTILEAIAATHDLVVPYHTERYQFSESWQGTSTPTWPPHLRR